MRWSRLQSRLDLSPELTAKNHKMDWGLCSIVPGKTTVLRSYSAEINGTQLVWLDTPPKPLVGQSVLVVLESTPTANEEPSKIKHYRLADLVGQLQWRGDALLAQRAQRDAW